jgi:hypothetical protein
MRLALASAWQPRGELERFVSLLPALHTVYEYLAVSLPPGAETELERQLSQSGIQVVRTRDWAAGRYAALQGARESCAEWIHYNDFDRLLRWVETRPQEWRNTVAAFCEADCIILGRTPEAYASHPQALVQTEAISNRVVSQLLGKQVDASAGGRGFSQAAAAFALANSQPVRALGTDAEWPILLHRAGFAIEYRTVAGLDWEIPDQYQSRAAGPDRQQAVARAYDADPRHWARRMEIALEIIQAGIDAAQRPLVASSGLEGSTTSYV